MGVTMLGYLKAMLSYFFILCLFESLTHGSEDITNKKSNYTRIIGGELATQGQFPYQAAWLVNGNLICGGTIYTPLTIITAAHCCVAVKQGIDQGAITLDDAEIRGGELEISVPSGMEQKRKIREMNIHPDYNTETTGQANDICLLYLESELTLNEQVK